MVGSMLLIGPIAALAACSIITWWQKSRTTKALQHQDRAQSTASSDTSRGMLMEPLLDDDDDKGESN